MTDITSRMARRLKNKVANIQTSGVFENHLETLGNIEIFQVTCINNVIGDPNFDMDGELADGTYFQIKKGNETKVFMKTPEMQSFLENYFETTNDVPSASIIL